MSLIQIERNLKKYYGLLTLICVIIGFSFPQLSFFSPYIPLFLAALVFSMVIEHQTSDFTQIAKHPRSVIALFTSNIILFPLIGILAGTYLLSVPSDVYVGILLLCFAPSPVVAALWSEMSGGDGAIAVTAALFSMLMSIVVYPIVLYFLGIASLSVALKVFSLLAMSIFLPAIIALFLRVEEEKYIPAKKTLTLISSFIGLFIIVVAIAHMAGNVLNNDGTVIIQLILFIAALLIVGFAYGYTLSRILNIKKKNKIAFLYTSGMRDGIIPLGVAITYFSPLSTLASTIMLIVMPFIVVGVYYWINHSSIQN